ncbi:PD-(D/E)XK nuclease family protein [Intrasporangium sp. DVR]|uniref:PD-(D/E)XK nuclease family protein n=1 Tax=Intrasporangium sp. DVR TaxID=3127867 RepID=UPI00313A6E8C
MAVTVSVTSYGAQALEVLRTVVAEVKRDDPMAPVMVVVPSNIAGIVARRHLAHGVTPHGNGVTGIWLSTLPRLAEQLAAPTLTGHGRRPATRPITTAAIRACLDADPGVFERVARHPSTARALARAHRDLRDLDDAARASLARTTSLVTEVVRVHRATTSRLEATHYDQTDLLVTATGLVRGGRTTTDPFGALVLYLPQDLTRAEMAFAQALAERGDLHVVAGLTGVPRADEAVLATLEALGGEAPTHVVTEPLAHRVLTASDSDDEVRCVVRDIVQTLRTTPAHRVAVLYSAPSPYARLLHEHLGAAGITVNGPGVRPVNERAVSRLLLGLLEAARTGFRRADVMRTLGEASTTTFTGERISVTRWERASREAGIVGGSDWQTRLDAYVRHQELDLREQELESTRARAERNRDTAVQLRDFVAELRLRFEHAATLTGWGDLGRWALELFQQLLPPESHTRLPLEEQYALGVIERTLSGLGALDAQGLTATLAGLEEVLGVELELALPRVGRFGEGVLVAPITHAIGLELDAVFLVGVSEDLFPGRLHDDSLLPERVRDVTNGQLPSVRTRFDRQHRCLLAAFDSAPRVTVTFPRGDLRRHTHRLPSRWLLPSLRRLSGIADLAATEWEKGIERSSDRLSSSPSFAGSLLRTETPATEQEWRVRAATAHQQLEDGIVEAARAMRAARESDEFTRFDGNLAGLEGLPDLRTGDRAVSPTALEHYANCPHTYFIQRMLGVEPVEAPEEAVEISPLDVGNLIHESVDALITDAGQARELPDYGEPWTESQRKRLQEIARAKADTYEAEGRTGHPRTWPRMRSQILAILDWMVDEDNRWRRAEDAKVVASELPFGLRGAEPVTLVLGDGGRVRFRGSADKVDQKRDGTLLVTDIKSGSQRTFKGIGEDDPVVHGEKLQLPVYAMAARAAHGDDHTPARALYWFVRKDRGRIELPLTDEVKDTYAATVGLLVSSMAAGVFPPRAPKDPDFKWVQCAYCNPDGLGHGAVRERWERKRLTPELAAYTGLVEPAATAATDEGDEQ